MAKLSLKKSNGSAPDSSGGAAHQNDAGGRKWATAFIVGVLVIYVLNKFYVPNAPLNVKVFLNAWFSLTSMGEIMVYILMALGLNIVVGYAGLLDLGYVAFWALGGYMAG